MALLPNLHFNDSTKIVILFGAGAPYSDLLSRAQRLPLGEDIKRALLDEAFENSSNREDEFRDKKLKPSERKLPLTFDLVWKKLVRDANNLPGLYDCLAKTLSRDKPIPKAYYLLARVMFSCRNLHAIATTNFDEHIDAALHEIAPIYGLTPLQNYRIVSTEQQFRFMERSTFPSGRILQKVHGTLSDPISIVAGFPAGSSIVREIPIVYRPLLRALSEATHIFFIGYSGTDHQLSHYIRDALAKASDKKVYIVCKTGAKAARKILFPKTSRKNVHVHPVDSTADAVLDEFWNKLPSEDRDGEVLLSPRERDLLSQGTKGLGLIVTNHGRYCSPSSRREATPADLHFNDLVHGEMLFPKSMSGAVERCIDSGEFQRLRRIRQLSFVLYRFPSTTHSRFEHSLGVAYLAQRYCQQVENFSRWPTDDTEHRGHLEWARTRVDTLGSRNLVLAALFHDVGHGPLGHTLDSLAYLFPEILHEETSKSFLLQALTEDAFADLNAVAKSDGLPVGDLADIILKKHPLSPVIDNESLDLDRIDFIFRDLLHSAISITVGERTLPASDACRMLRNGLPDLIAGFTIMPPEHRKMIGEAECYFNVSDVELAADQQSPALQALHLLGTAYGTLYDQVYYCWQNACAQAMIAKCLQRVLITRRFRLEEILPLSDEELFDQLLSCGDPEARELAILVKFRRLYDLVLTIYFEGPMPDINVTQLERFFNVPDSDKRSPTDWLFAFRKQKSASAWVRLAGQVMMPLLAGAPKSRQLYEKIDFEGRARARLLVFKWPGVKTTVSDAEKMIRRFCTDHAVDLKNTRFKLEPG